MVHDFNYLGVVFFYFTGSFILHYMYVYIYILIVGNALSVFGVLLSH